MISASAPMQCTVWSSLMPMSGGIVLFATVMAASKKYCPLGTGGSGKSFGYGMDAGATAIFIDKTTP